VFLLAFLENQLRRAPPLFACSRELQGLREGFGARSGQTTPLEVPPTHI
jgi:hypothetical protein